MKWLLALFVLGISTAFCFKSGSVSLNLVPKFGKKDLVLGKNYFLPAINDSVSIDVFRIYISDICFRNEGKTVYADKNRYHLVDLERSNVIMTTRMMLFDSIRFSIGIDSLTNSGGVKGGDLDPTKNMYWAWQSGYINFKLEGKSKACKTRNNVFQYHIGGYSYPNNSLQTVTVAQRGNGPFEIHFDLEKFLTGVGLQTTNEIMSPSGKAMQVAKLYKTIFEAQ
jgi:hypothetical protein